MNLIEQLGGYENSRGLLNMYEYSISFKYYKEFDGDFESAGHVDVFIPDLKDALLKYRRQHNIFEVGDLIVLPYTNYRSDTFELTEIFKKSCDEMGIAYRHATDAEIQAGRRL